MSRKFKFRAWHIESKYFLTIENLIYPERCPVIPEYGAFTLNDRGQVILQQFTGLLDRNGKEIYEGDICHIWGHPQLKEDFEFNATVDWIEDHPQFNFRRIEAPRISFDMGINTCEVIGNIFENPELLYI